MQKTEYLFYETVLSKDFSTMFIFHMITFANLGYKSGAAELYFSIVYDLVCFDRLVAVCLLSPSGNPV